MHALKKIQHYIETLFAPEEPPLSTQRQSLHNIAIPPAQGKLLHLLARLSGAHQILEVGTLGGVSAHYLATALPPGGHLLTLEIDPERAELARTFLHDLPVTVQTGDAHQILPTLTGPYDLIFLDADKPRYPDYLEPLLRLSRPGTLLLVDNLIRKGKVIDPQDPHQQALATFNQHLAAHPRLSSIILPTLVGYGGGQLDGMSLCRVD